MNTRIPEEKGFSTQSDLIKRFSKTYGKGLCGPLSNLYAKEHLLGLLENSFLKKSREEIYNMAIEEQNHQATLKTSFGAKGSLYSAFHDVGVPYAIYEIETPKVTENLISNIPSNHLFINYPTPASEALPAANHQVYFGRLSKDKCTYFNANKKGGEYIDKCNKVAGHIAKDIQEEASFDGRPTYFASPA